MTYYLGTRHRASICNLNEIPNLNILRYQFLSDGGKYPLVLSQFRNLIALIALIVPNAIITGHCRDKRMFVVL